MPRPLMFLSDIQRHRKYRLRVNLEFQFRPCKQSQHTQRHAHVQAHTHKPAQLSHTNSMCICCYSPFSLPVNLQVSAPVSGCLLFDNFSPYSVVSADLLYNADICTTITKTDDKQFCLNNSGFPFCWKNPNDLVASETVMRTDVDTSVNLMTQQKPSIPPSIEWICCLWLFCLCNWIHNPATNVNTQCFAILSCWPCRKQAYSRMAASTMAQPSKPSGSVMQHWPP